MYIPHFQLKEHPFQITPDSDFLYMSAAHSRAKAYMDYSIRNHDGFVIITGEVGAGKTTLIRKLLSEFDDGVVVAKIFQTQLDETQFLQAVLVEFGVNPFNAGKVELMDMLSSFLIESFLKRKQIVLIVDEAQNLNRRVLEEIRMLSGLETEKQKILHVILVGQPELNETLDAPGLEQLTQRVRLRFHIAALTEAEAADYVYHRLRVAGAPDPEALFTRDAIPLIYEYTGGIPRLINTLCDTALTCAFADDVSAVDESVVKSAVIELQWKPFSMRSRLPLRTEGLAPSVDVVSAVGGRDIDQLARAVAALEPRLDSIEALLRHMATILQRRNRISLKFGQNQVAQILKQVSAEIEKLQAHHEI
ncbi:MAG: ExeA family protein [Acidiferrobacter sp.]